MYVCRMPTSKANTRPVRDVVPGFPTFVPTGRPSRIPRDQDVTYHNGTVLVGPTLTIYNIYYGRFTNTTMDLMDYFARYDVRESCCIQC